MPDHPDTLVKYCTTEAAEQILSSSCLRWSAPNLFSDPFELDHHSELSFTPEELLKGVIRTATALIFSRDVPRGNSPLATVIRRWREEERFDSPEEAEEVLTELMGRMVEQRLEDINKMMADWQDFTRHLRICCFSAKPDNLPSWQRFADNHHGVALRFRCGQKTSFPDPRMISYQQLRPEITSLKQQMNAVLHNEHYDAQAHFLEKFLVKPPMSQSEREWRCFHHATDHDPSSQQPDDSLWYEDRPFLPEEISSIYLGAFLPEDARNRLRSLIKNQYPEVRLFQCRPVPGKYEIEFERLRIK